MTVLDELQNKPLIDVGGITLRDLMSDTTDALDEAILSVTSGAENESQKSVSAFNSAI